MDALQRKRPTLSLLALALLVLGWAGAAAAWCPSETECEVARLINLERAVAGLVPLVIETRLTEAARTHSSDMVGQNFFSHTGFDGSSFWDRCVAAGYPMRAGGEDIAAGYRTPADVVEGWMNSPGHRAIILTATYRDIGVGHVEGGAYGHYWTADFGLGAEPGLAPGPVCLEGPAPSAPVGLRLIPAQQGGG